MIITSPPSGKAFAHGRLPNLREKALSCSWGLMRRLAHLPEVREKVEKISWEHNVT
jgi:hypothetical protein